MKKDLESDLKSALVDLQMPENRGVPPWASVLFILVGAIVLVFGLVKLVKFAWFF